MGEDSVIGCSLNLIDGVVLVDAGRRHLLLIIHPPPPLPHPNAIIQYTVSYQITAMTPLLCIRSYELCKSTRRWSDNERPF